MVVFGTRPEAIKIAPVIRAMSGSPVLDPVVVVTGQHREMLRQVLESFAIVPDADLDVFCPGQTLSRMTTRLLNRLAPLLEEGEPDAVVVQGDTTTTFVAALAAFYHHVPVAHVEAGLRTGDLRAPFPEEANRRLAGQLTTLHLAPTAGARANLEAEGVGPERILVTGNTVIDALLWARDLQLPYGSAALEQLDQDGRRVVLVTVHRRESWGKVMEGIGVALAWLAREQPDVVFVFPIHRNPAVRHAIRSATAGLANILVVEPLPYGPFVRLMSRAHLILTDSGGIQEEAPSLGKPVLVLRERTERPEAVVAGTAELVGTDPSSIVAGVNRLLGDSRAYEAMAGAANPFGDGRAAERCVAGLLHLLGGGTVPEEFGAPARM